MKINSQHTTIYGIHVLKVKFIREYYNQLHASYLNKSDEIIKCLEIHKLPKQIQEETENLNRLITKKLM